MKYPTAFHLISTEFPKARIPILVIGGFAVNAYQVTRTTADLDLLMTEEYFEKAKSIFEREGYQLTVQERLFARWRSEKEPSSLAVDAVFVDPTTFASILKDSREQDLKGIHYRVPSLNHLLALKIHALKNNPNRRGFVDLHDVLSLTQTHGIDPRSSSFKELCLKYGTAEIYDKILQNMGPWKS